MEGFWYYSKDDKSIGPLSFAQLIGALSHLKDPHRVLVWHASFDDWREAKAIPEILAVMPTSAQPAPSIVQPSIVDGDRNPSNKPKKSTGWRNAAGIVVTIVAFTMARNLMHSATSPAKPDPTSAISGPAKDAFIKGGMETCLKTQENDADNKRLQLSRDILTGYCLCYMGALANSITYGDLERYPKNATTITPEMQTKIDKASPACLEDMQRKLMGTRTK